MATSAEINPKLNKVLRAVHLRNKTLGKGLQYLRFCEIWAAILIRYASIITPALAHLIAAFTILGAPSTPGDSQRDVSRAKARSTALSNVGALYVLVRVVFAAGINTRIGIVASSVAIAPVVAANSQHLPAKAVVLAFFNTTLVCTSSWWRWW